MLPMNDNNHAKFIQIMFFLVCIYFIFIYSAALGSNLYAESLVLTSATYAVAMSNFIPALTLVMAVIFRYLFFEQCSENSNIFHKKKHATEHIILFYTG